MTTANTPPRRFDVAIVHKIYEFYKLFHKSLILFSKTEKYLLGYKIENVVLKILEIVLSAVYVPKYEKNKILKTASNKIDFLKYLIRIAYDIKSINLKRYILLQENIVEIGKMLGGWIKSTTQ